MRKQIQEHKYFLLGITLITIVLIGYIYKDATMQAHDIFFHLSNIDNLVKTKLHLSPIMPNIGHNLGYGLYIFYPFLPHLSYGVIAVIFSIFSLPTIYSILTTNILVAILSSIFVYFLSYRLSKNKKVSFLSSILYLVFPYRLGNITVRMALNEYFAGLFIPMVLLAFTYLFQEKKDSKKFLLWFSIGYIGLIFSHYLIALYFSLILIPILACYYKKVLKNYKPILLGILFVSIMVLPNIILFMEHFGNDYLVYKENYVTSYSLIEGNLLSIHDYFIPNQNYDWTVPYYFSISSLILFFISIYTAIKKKKKVYIIFSIITIVLCISMSSSFLWKNLPPIFYNIQFPWRLLLIVALFLSLVAPICLLKVRNKYIYPIALIGILLFSFPLIQKLSNRIYHYDFTIGYDIEMGTGNLGEYYPNAYLDYQSYYKEKNTVNLTMGKATITVLDNQKSYVIEAKNVEDAILEFPKIYYKGYQLIDQNHKKIPIKENEKGLLEASIQEDGVYTLTYTGTILYQLFSIFRNLFIVSFSFIYLYHLVSIKRWKRN